MLFKDLQVYFNEMPKTKSRQQLEHSSCLMHTHFEKRQTLVVRTKKTFSFSRRKDELVKPISVFYSKFFNYKQLRINGSVIRVLHMMHYY